MQRGESQWHRVLVIDDGSILLGALGEALYSRGYEVHAVSLDDATEALPHAIEYFGPDVVLLTQAMLDRCRRWLGERYYDVKHNARPKLLALRQGDQASDATELRRTLRHQVTICTPADLQALLP